MNTPFTSKFRGSTPCKGQIWRGEFWFYCVKDTQTVRQWEPCCPKTSEPWVTAEIRKLIKRRDQVYKQMEKLGSKEKNAKSQNLRRTIQQMMQRSYWEYINNTKTSSDSDSPQSFKHFWSYKHQRTPKTGILSLWVNGRLISDPRRRWRCSTASSCLHSARVGPTPGISFRPSAWWLWAAALKWMILPSL